MVHDLFSSIEGMPKPGSFLVQCQLQKHGMQHQQLCCILKPSLHRPRAANQFSYPSCGSATAPVDYTRPSSPSSLHISGTAIVVNRSPTRPCHITQRLCAADPAAASAAAMASTTAAVYTHGQVTLCTDVATIVTRTDMSCCRGDWRAGILCVWYCIINREGVLFCNLRPMRWRRLQALPGW